MKKLMIGIMMLLVMVSSVFAGSLYIDDPDFEDGDQYYNGTATIDADTLNGETATEIITPLWSHLSANSAAWSRDRIGGGGIGQESLSKYLIGSKALFNVYDTFLEYLNEYFVPRSVYEKDITELRERLDFFEASQSGLSTDEFQRQKALSQVSGESMGSYGAYTCDSDVCIKSVN